MKQIFKIFIILVLGLGMVACQKKQEIKPNIIYIYINQQSETMMSCAGNKYLKTPAMDYIAENGIRFTRAYTTNPVCSPSRVSMMTGRFPGYFTDKDGSQAQENGGSMKISEVREEVKNTTIAAFLQKAGYDLVFGGKEHLPPSLRPKALGFNFITNDERDILANEAAKYIKGKHDKTYFMIVSLINPHDICYMAIRDFAESNGLTMSMTEKYDPYENAITERINRTLKYEYGLKLTIKNTKLTQKITKRAINIYNNIRPHLSLDLNTPKYVHLNQNIEYKLYRKNKKKLELLTFS